MKFIISFIITLSNVCSSRELNNTAALRLAKQHVEEWYPVVGVLEDINATLSVLQHQLPEYFAGVVDLYYNELLGKVHLFPSPIFSVC